MRSRKIGLVCAIALALAACGDTDTKRALSGGAIGGVTGAVVGGGATLGIVVGAAAGIFCNDVSPSYCLR
jgi:hypothetical protein